MLLSVGSLSGGCVALLLVDGGAARSWSLLRDRDSRAVARVIHGSSRSSAACGEEYTREIIIKL